MDPHRHDAKTAQKYRSFIFGVEDSLVSTLGVLSGVAIADVPRATIFLTGVVLIFVEAFSMSAGSFLSESFGAEFLKKKRSPSGKSVAAALAMFAGYFFAGFVPLFPYMLWDVGTAFPVSVLVALAALFVLGLWSGRVSHISAARAGVRMFAVGGIAMAVGLLAGSLMKRFFI
jgi:VIT1/CCC1 family predicted Fe2+/Mn2+ transporter